MTQGRRQAVDTVPCSVCGDPIPTSWSTGLCTRCRLKRNYEDRRIPCANPECKRMLSGRSKNKSQFTGYCRSCWRKFCATGQFAAKEDNGQPPRPKGRGLEEPLVD